ncbi:toprim domain-containing protein [Streptomyces sp. NPDC059761]|uniref:toprim domain-containing protein n=1 Tax=Streptomyces sp. NPDC059761 TaxID=3346937 RepID=UPI003652C13D
MKHGTALDELAALPESHKTQLATDVLDSLGITVARRQGDELIHACQVSDYHSDQERNPTAALNTTNLLWHCLGCGSGGTILWLIATLRNVTVEQARDWLNGEAGLTRAMELPDLLALFDSLYTEHRRAPLPIYSERMLDRWKANGIPDYITGERGIPEATAAAMDLCTDPDGYLDRKPTGPRAVIPHRWNGQLVGWQSRRLPGADPAAPKYLSTPGFPREETIFDYDPSRSRAVVVESPMSDLRHRHHQPMEATFGAAVSNAQIEHLARGRERLIWWPDNDTAGWKMAQGREHKDRHYPGAPERASRYCRNLIVESPFGADPADLSDGIVDLLIADAVPWQVWQPPEFLYCHLCFQPYHPGAPCAVPTTTTASKG